MVDANWWLHFPIKLHSHESPLLFLKTRMNKASSGFASLTYNKGSQVSLCSVWLFGLIITSLSIFATQRLPSYEIKSPRSVGDSDTPSVTIFSAPASFTASASVGARQLFAIRSWLALSPQVNVVLFGKDPSLVSVAAALGSRVSIESDTDFNFLGTPFFHSMIARSQASNSDVSVLIDPELVLLPDFVSALKFSNKLEHDWLLIAIPSNVSHFPFDLDESGEHWLQKDGEPVKLKKLQEVITKKQNWFPCGKKMLMAWNSVDMPLHAGVLPPFLYGKGLHNQWLINEAMTSDLRFVFDVSGAISILYPNELGHLGNPSDKDSGFDGAKNRSWEYQANSFFGALYGTLYFRGAQFSDKIVKLVKCDGHFQFIDTIENFDSPYRDRASLSLWKRRTLRSKGEKIRKRCLERIKSLDKNMGCSFKELFDIPAPIFLPLTLDSLISTVAGNGRTIVLSIAGNSYRDMLMSWVCRLRHLRIPNFVVCAIDEEVYRFSVLQGLPVFKDPLAPSDISFNNCHFGTECFQRVTKVKSRVVLQILRMGYNVLLSDVDIYWFKNPLPLLHSFGPGVLVVQSDAYNETGPINLPRRLNSGFYFARSDEVTIAAMEKVVKHALVSNLSEQPSFYDVLCGEGGANRLSDDKCLEPETNLKVHFLDRNLFPNGAYQGLWEKADVKEACVRKGCVILHNNWINGRQKKLERQVSSGLWAYDASTRMCVRN